jgi:hypothetical protein
LHSVVDAVGVVPGPTGIVANGVNAVSYAFQGDNSNAGLSLLAMIPFQKLLAQGGKAVKFISKGAKPFEVALDYA